MVSTGFMCRKESLGLKNLLSRMPSKCRADLYTVFRSGSLLRMCSIVVQTWSCFLPACSPPSQCL